MLGNVDSVRGAATATPSSRVQPQWAVLPVAFRKYRAPRWWMEISILLVLNFAYEHLRNLVPNHEQVAINRGLAVQRFTEQLHLSFEPALNHFVATHEIVALGANYYYSFLHLSVTAGVLIWLFWKHPRLYRSLRTVLVLTTSIALVSFYFLPMAPPRLLPTGTFIDISHAFPTFGSWSDPTVAEHTNQYAAMPSLHCAWALWAGVTIFMVARHRVVRAIGLVYPVMTFLVVVGTANHFAIDGVAGAMVLAASLSITWSLFGHSAYVPALTHEELTLTPAPPAHHLSSGTSSARRRLQHARNAGRPSFENPE